MHGGQEAVEKLKISKTQGTLSELKKQQRVGRMFKKARSPARSRSLASAFVGQSPSAEDSAEPGPARPQQARRRGVLCSVRRASKRRENKAGGLFQHPARVEKGRKELRGANRGKPRTGIRCKNLCFFFQTVSGEIVKVIGHCQGKPSVCHPRSFPSVIPAVCSGDPSCCSCSGVEKMDSR